MSEYPAPYITGTTATPGSADPAPVPCRHCGQPPVIEQLFGITGATHVISCSCKTAPCVSANTKRAAITLWDRCMTPVPAPDALTSTTRWTRIKDSLPPYGLTVAIWIPTLHLVIRAYRDAHCESKWRICGSRLPPIHAGLVKAWAHLPNGPLPPPDNCDATRGGAL